MARKPRNPNQKPSKANFANLLYDNSAGNLHGFVFFKAVLILRKLIAIYSVNVLSAQISFTVF